eukprot:Sspe_Gene.58295::Locus_31969_Transcript_1_1_Confidence_1.000_Length_4390::g.58295::m.58295
MTKPKSSSSSGRCPYPSRSLFPHTRAMVRTCPHPPTVPTYIMKGNGSRDSWVTGTMAVPRTPHSEVQKFWASALCKPESRGKYRAPRLHPPSPKSLPELPRLAKKTLTPRPPPKDRARAAAQIRADELEEALLSSLTAEELRRASLWEYTKKRRKVSPRKVDPPLSL